MQVVVRPAVGLFCKLEVLQEAISLVKGSLKRLCVASCKEKLPRDNALTPCSVFTEHSQDFWSYNKLLLDLGCSVCTSEITYLRSSAQTSARCARLACTKNVGPIFH